MYNYIYIHTHTCIEKGGNLSDLTNIFQMGWHQLWSVPKVLRCKRMCIEKIWVTTQKSNPSWSIRTIGKPEDIELRSCRRSCPKGVLKDSNFNHWESPSMNHQYCTLAPTWPIPGPTKIGGFSQGCEVETGGCLSSSDSGVRRPFGFSARGAQETVAQNWPQMKALLEPVTLNPYSCLRCLILWWPCEDAKMLVARLSGGHGVLASVGEFKASVWFLKRSAQEGCLPQSILSYTCFRECLFVLFSGVSEVFAKWNISVMSLANFQIGK